MTSPLALRYLGEGKFAPNSNYWARKADEAFEAGRTYTIVEHAERSSATHAHLFAVLHEAFMSIPDALLADYPNETVLRKKMLIRAGYCHQNDVLCASHAEAQRMAVLAHNLDPYCIAIPKMNVCRIMTAESLSRKAMGAKRFQEAKEGILRELEKLLGVSPGALEKAEAAA